MRQTEDQYAAECAKWQRHAEQAEAMAYDRSTQLGLV